MTKAQVRALSKEAGLFTWDKPAYACLATRVPTGQLLTAEALGKIEKAEDFLSGLGFSDFRVRTPQGRARIQVREEQLGLVLEKRQEIWEALSRLFTGIDLDLQTR